MIRIRRQDVAAVAKSLTIAARNARNAEGLRIWVDLLGALTALCNGPVVPDDTAPLRMTADGMERAA